MKGYLSSSDHWSKISLYCCSVQRFPFTKTGGSNQSIQIAPCRSKIACACMLSVHLKVCQVKMQFAMHLSVGHLLSFTVNKAQQGWVRVVTAAESSRLPELFTKEDWNHGQHANIHLLRKTKRYPALLLPLAGIMLKLPIRHYIESCFLLSLNFYYTPSPSVCSCLYLSLYFSSCRRDKRGNPKFPEMCANDRRVFMSHSLWFYVNFIVAVGSNLQRQQESLNHD